ncbi:helix-turn-helix protein [Micromonospora sp. Llam0]|uniref:helix-turn-helix domain-containing protein n=1 Tax=Micromonospora sp. Llam0 TaxID=2485143 RepID=UPI000F47408F|nr:helix-turn-helix transcriptional regulator [Micromonospora sp. Llam0]ROO51037.1 helix-turn-helix protein [Micromonospora sp. Llam0]
MTDNANGARTRLTDLVAEEIRALQGRRRVSGRELARRLGETPSWVNYRLTGVTPINLNDLERIATALGVTVVDLLPTPATSAARVTRG